MPKKLQQFYVYKMQSGRVRDANYHVEVKDINEARSNGEIISLGDSQVLRSLRKLKGQELNQEEIDSLFLEKKRIKRKENTKENRKRLFEVEKRIDDILFVPEICSLVIEDNKHYEKAIKQGLYINNKKYVRLLCGAANARKNTTFWIWEELEKPLKKLLNNDRDETVKLNPSKFNAYFGLYNSATLPVSTPEHFCVVPDCLVKRIERVEFITESTEENVDDSIEERDLEIESNLFDGEGLCSVEQSQKWANELGLDWTPSSWCIRGSFLKGMVATFDYKQFCIEKNGNPIVKDVWGQEHNLEDVDVFVSASQLKLWNSYSSYQNYVDACSRNEIGWGISRYTPRQDKNSVFSNYQFLQVLDLDDEQIERLCYQTVEWFNGVCGGDINYVLLYLLGEMCNGELEEGWFDKIDDPIVKAILIDNSIIGDPYIKQHIAHSINKKIEESYLGNLVLEGNYSVMVSDPVAMAEWIFGLPVKGLLNRGEHYSHYWNEHNIKQVAAMRAPLTWRSEVNILNLKKNDETEKWYKHLGTGIIYNVHGVDCMLHADSDFDMDIVCTTNNQEVIDGAYKGLLPITYDKKPTSKVVISEGELWRSDISAFNSTIGAITNLATTLNSMLPNYDKGSREYAEIINRMKLCRKEQGQAIDKAKGIVVKDTPKYWTNYTKITNDNSEEEKQRIEFNNNLIVDRRPLWMKYLYQAYKSRYNDYQSKFDEVSETIAYVPLEVLFEKEYKTEEEQKLIDYHEKFNPFINTNNVIQKISNCMQENVRLMKISMKKTDCFNPMLLVDKDVIIDDIKLKKMKEIYKKYKTGKKNFFVVDGNKQTYCSNLDQYVKTLRQMCNQKISNSAIELATYAVYCTYLEGSADKSFVWKLFGDGVLENIERNSDQTKTSIPMLCESGSIKYLGRLYQLKEVTFL